MAGYSSPSALRPAPLMPSCLVMLIDPAEPAYSFQVELNSFLFCVLTDLINSLFDHTLCFSNACCSVNLSFLRLWLRPSQFSSIRCHDISLFVFTVLPHTSHQRRSSVLQSSRSPLLFTSFLQTLLFLGKKNRLTRYSSLNLFQCRFLFI